MIDIKEFAKVFNSETRGQILVRRGAGKKEERLILTEFYADLENEIRGVLGFQAESVEEAKEILMKMTLGDAEDFIEKALLNMVSGDATTLQ